MLKLPPCQHRTLVYSVERIEQQTTFPSLHLYFALLLPLLLLPSPFILATAFTLIPAMFVLVLLHWGT